MLLRTKIWLISLIVAVTTTIAQIHGAPIDESRAEVVFVRPPYIDIIRTTTERSNAAAHAQTSDRTQVPSTAAAIDNEVESEAELLMRSALVQAMVELKDTAQLSEKRSFQTEDNEIEGNAKEAHDTTEPQPALNTLTEPAEIAQTIQPSDMAAVTEVNMENTTAAAMLEETTNMPSNEPATTEDNVDSATAKAIVELVTELAAQATQDLEVTTVRAMLEGTTEVFTKQQDVVMEVSTTVSAKQGLATDQMYAGVPHTSEAAQDTATEMTTPDKVADVAPQTTTEIQIPTTLAAQSEQVQAIEQEATTVAALQEVVTIVTSKMPPNEEVNTEQRLSKALPMESTTVVIPTLENTQDQFTKSPVETTILPAAGAAVPDTATTGNDHSGASVAAIEAITFTTQPSIPNSSATNSDISKETITTNTLPSIGLNVEHKAAESASTTLSISNTSIASENSTSLSVPMGVAIANADSSANMAESTTFVIIAASTDSAPSNLDNTVAPTESSLNTTTTELPILAVIIDSEPDMPTALNDTTSTQAVPATENNHQVVSMTTKRPADAIAAFIMDATTMGRYLFAGNTGLPPLTTKQAAQSTATEAAMTSTEQPQAFTPVVDSVTSPSAAPVALNENTPAPIDNLNQVVPANEAAAFMPLTEPTNAAADVTASANGLEITATMAASTPENLPAIDQIANSVNQMAEVVTDAGAASTSSDIVEETTIIPAVVAKTEPAALLAVTELPAAQVTRMPGETVAVTSLPEKQPTEATISATLPQHNQQKEDALIATSVPATHALEKEEAQMPESIAASEVQPAEGILRSTGLSVDAATEQATLATEHALTYAASSNVVQTSDSLAEATDRNVAISVSTVRPKLSVMQETVTAATVEANDAVANTAHLGTATDIVSTTNKFAAPTTQAPLEAEEVTNVPTKPAPTAVAAKVADPVEKVSITPPKARMLNPNVATSEAGTMEIAQQIEPTGSMLNTVFSTTSSTSSSSGMYNAESMSLTTTEAAVTNLPSSVTTSNNRTPVTLDPWQVTSTPSTVTLAEDTFSTLPASEIAEGTTMPSETTERTMEKRTTQDMPVRANPSTEAAITNDSTTENLEESFTIMAPETTAAAVQGLAERAEESELVTQDATINSTTFTAAQGDPEAALSSTTAEATSSYEDSIDATPAPTVQPASAVIEQFIFKTISKQVQQPAVTEVPLTSTTVQSLEEEQTTIAAEMTHAIVALTTTESLANEVRSIEETVTTTEATTATAAITSTATSSATASDAATTTEASLVEQTTTATADTTILDVSSSTTTTAMSSTSAARIDETTATTIPASTASSSTTNDAHTTLLPDVETTTIMPESYETTLLPYIVGLSRARALKTPTPAHIERLLNEDGVEVLYGYSSVQRN